MLQVFSSMYCGRARIKSRMCETGSMKRLPLFYRSEMISNSFLKYKIYAQFGIVAFL